jgi:V8-like Glu-specific endopeptidase
MAKSRQDRTPGTKAKGRPTESVPLTPDELLTHDNAPAKAPIPVEVARQLATPRIIVSNLDGPIKPEALTRDGQTGLEAYQWRLPERAIFGLPGRTARRLSPESFQKAQSSPAAVEPFRPDWAAQVYHPKRTIAPPWTIPVHRGDRSGELFYGVYPPDDRAVYYPQGYPWQCVGRLFAWNDASADSWAWSGSGVLIGPRVVLTAGHVVPWDAKTWKMQFVPAYYDGKSILGSGATSWVSDAQGWDVSYKSRVPNAFDMAVLRLYDPLGTSLGYFGAKTYTSDMGTIRYFNITGYPGAIAGAERPSYQPGIEVLDSDADADAQEIEHHGDATAGDSGAPFWATWPDGFPYAIGTISGGEAKFEPKENANEDNNIAAGGKAMVDLINTARTNWQ